jgi:hypothetical protein
MRTSRRNSAVGSAFWPVIRFHTFRKGKLIWAFRHPLTADAPLSTVNRYLLRWRRNCACALKQLQGCNQDQLGRVSTVLNRCEY